MANDHQISLEDEEMRHGRKSSAKRFDGYKRHLARDIDEQLILAAETLPANTPDTAGVDPLLVAVELQHRAVTSLHLDRGYLGDPLINIYDAAGVVIGCKPWPVRNPAGHFSKPDFQIDLETLQATCPAGQIIPIRV
ncbi:MAG: transposase [Candidatus Competibacteraceae bacterium]